MQRATLALYLQMVSRSKATESELLPMCWTVSGVV